MASETATKAPAEFKRVPRTKKSNYNLIHKDPLPLTITGLPPLIPHNPISLLHLVIAYLFPPKSAYALPIPLYSGVFSPTTISVNVTDAESIQGLWCRGFFGKGNLSRSEPTWLTRTKRRLGAISENESLTAEEVTTRRRSERKGFKKERAKKEKEKLAKVLAKEGKIVKGSGEELSEAQPVSEVGVEYASVLSGVDGSVTPNSLPAVNRNIRFTKESESRPSISNAQRPVIEIEDLEHLQLTLEEAFFLSYGLGVLQVTDEKTGQQLSNQDLLWTFRRHGYFPPAHRGELQPDDQFMLNYVVYHHYRSLGWVVKTGVKFGVDYLLYNRGPAFSHAEFAILVLPSYSDLYWANDTKRKASGQRQWHWLHCVNRVCSQVKKTVILCYVVVPPPPEAFSRGSNITNKVVSENHITDLLEGYRVREVALRRWLPSRNRD